MKRLIIYLFVVIMSFTFQIIKAQDYGDDGGDYQSDENVGMFYSSLSPYGSWIQLDGGLTVWRPLHLGHDWAPYRNGHWVWTDDGWYWDSYDPFGYVVFHYGRWYNDNYYGWIWVPDNVWAPAWVEWRYDDNYIGWAPLPPYASFSFSFGINFTNDYVTPYSYWHFVNYRFMCDPNPYDHFVPDRYKYRIYSDTRYRTNYGYSDGRVINRGVDVDYIRQRSGGRIVERQIQRTGDPRNINGGDRNSNVVRAFIPSREQLSRTDGRNIDIKRGVRPSTMDISRVGVGSRDNSARNNNPWIQRNNQPNSRNENPIKPREVTPQSRNENPWIQRNNPNTRNENPWIQRNNKPEKRNDNPWIQRNNQPSQRNENPWILKNNKPESRNINPGQQRNNQPQIRQENRGSRAPEVKKENNNNRNNNNQKRDGGNRERH